MMWSNARRTLSALLVGIAIAAPCGAQPSGSSPTTIAERLKTLYPATQFGAITETPWAGVFEVVLGNQLAYVDASGEFFLFGHLYDMKSQRDITAQRKDILTRIDFAALPLSDALKDVRGNGSRTLAIFSDPDCPHCRKLEADIKGLTDVTIYTFPMPLASLHPDARAKAIAVWCAGNRVGAWQALMSGDALPVSKDCAHPVDRNVALGERLRISGTPTLIAADGRVLAGAAGLAQIEVWLNRDRQDAPR